ncbi:opsin, ultraviolet-sensitive-like [Homarus americanus]|uniref:opsin, ultraviolet-sensitive-like n=1 Tax=Homarus americanus TaxID=6706 RepID=UPI001C438B6B|nr:opsin, ultraviolet-sensitive-like [Homarus americanus]
MWPPNGTTCGQPLCLGMNAPADLVPLISEHWMRFPQPHPLLHITLGITFTLLTTIAFVGNLTVIIMYCRYRRLQNSSNLLVTNLALADLLMMSKAPIFIINSFMQGPYTGRTGCEVYGAVSLLAGLSAIWFLTAISLDRYYVVRHSLNTHHRSPRFQSWAVVGVVWVFSCFVTLLPVFGWNRYVPEGVLSGCTVDYLSESWVDRSFVYMLLVIAWASPMAAVIFSYTYIAIKVSLSVCLVLLGDISWVTRIIYNLWCGQQTETRVVVLLALWTLSWSPYALVVAVSVTFDSAVITPLLATLPSILCKASACLNPYVYGLNLPSFRRELARILLRDLHESIPAEASRLIGRGAHSTATAAVTATYRSRSELSSPVQRFMLPNGEVVLAVTYQEAKRKAAKTRQRPSTHVPITTLHPSMPAKLHAQSTVQLQITSV